GAGVAFATIEGAEEKRGVIGARGGEAALGDFGQLVGNRPAEFIAAEPLGTDKFHGNLPGRSGGRSGQARSRPQEQEQGEREAAKPETKSGRHGSAETQKVFQAAGEAAVHLELP